MSRAAAILGLLVLGTAASARADEEPAEAHAFVEIRAARERVFVGEPFTLTLRIGIDRAYFDEHAVELFRRRVDLPVQVGALWLASPPGCRALDEEAGRGDVRFALDGREVSGARREPVSRGGRTFEVVEHARRYLPETPGSHALEATLRFAYASRFEEDFLGGRVAVDRRDAVVHAPAFTLRIDPLPEAGRPAGFGGAVGRFAASAAVAPSASGAEGGLALTLVVEGEGNLAFVDPPPPELLAGFHVFGLVDDHGASRRTVIYDVEPLPGTTLVPALPFVFFDPGPPAGYRVVHTEPLPLAGPAPVPEDAAFPGRAATRGAFPWGWILAGASLLLTLLALGRLRRSRLTGATSPVPTATWRMRLEAPEADAAGVLADALAEHLGVPSAAVIGPDLAARLVRAGVGPDLASRAARSLEVLVAARFGGGGAEEDARAQVADLLVSLDDALRPHGP